MLWVRLIRLFAYNSENFIHCAFFRVSVPIQYKVKRLRDGRTFATRKVDAIQKEKVIFTLLASFQVFLILRCSCSCSFRFSWFKSITSWWFLVYIRGTFIFVRTLILQKEELGFKHQEVSMPSVPTPDEASNTVFIQWKKA